MKDVLAGILIASVEWIDCIDCCFFVRDREVYFFAGENLLRSCSASI